MAPRLPRGTRAEPVTAGWEIEKATRTRLNAIARGINMSGGALLDELVTHMPLDARGRPAWLPDEPLNDGELPIGDD